MSKAPNPIDDRILATLPGLCGRFHVRQLDLFGSAVTGQFDLKRSDLDFLVTFEDLSPVDYARAWSGLQEELEALFERPVDLLTEASLENPYLRRRVAASRRRLYSASQ